MWAIFIKELRELSRDKRTLNFTVLVPTVLLPALIIGLAYYLYSYSETREESTLRYAVVETAPAAQFPDPFTGVEGFERIEPEANAEPRALIDGQELDFVLGVAPAAAPSDQMILTLYLGLTSNAWTERRVRERVEAQNEELRERALTSRGMSIDEMRGLWEPMSLDVVNVRSEREEVGEDIAGVLPYLLLIVCLIGAMYPAIDIAAGEKERGTLQTLVATPVPRLHIVGGKFLVIFATSLLAGILSILSVLIWTILIGQSVGAGYLVNALSVLGVSTVLLICLLLVPLAATFAALMLAISVFARTFKEAQSYAMPLNVVVFVPAIIVLLPDVVLDWKWALMPLTNVALVIKSLLLGNLDTMLLGITFVSSAAVAVVLLLFCVNWFQREGVLFREAS